MTRAGWLAALAWCVLAEAAAASVVAGAARAPLEMPPGVPLAGYSRRGGKPSTGVHDAPSARALVLRDDDTTAILVSCDLLIIDEQLFDAVRRRLIAEGQPEDVFLLLAATHTHSGPGAYGRRFLEKLSMGHYEPEVFERIVDGIAAAVKRASEGLVPVAIGYAAAPTQGLIVNRVTEDGAVDNELAVAALYPDGVATPLAVLVNFSAHPTTLGAWNMELSGDYPGVVTGEIERAFPGSVCLFFSGAVGDQGPAATGEGFARSEALGRPLAAQARELLADLRPSTPHEISAAQERLRLPPARVRVASWLTLPRLLGRRFVDDDATLSVLRAGSLALVGAPCDMAAELGQRLKSAARAEGSDPMVIGFACDYIGYCVPESLYRQREYEASMAFNGPRAGELRGAGLGGMLGGARWGGGCCWRRWPRAASRGWRRARRPRAWSIVTDCPSCICPERPGRSDGSTGNCCASRSGIRSGTCWDFSTGT